MTIRMTIRRPDFYSPTTEVQALVNTVRPIAGNNDTRKYVTLLVVVVWAALELGNAYGLATLPEWMMMLRLLVGALFGRMWQIEADALAGADNGPPGE